MSDEELPERELAREITGCPECGDLLMYRHTKKKEPGKLSLWCYCRSCNLRIFWTPPRDYWLSKLAKIREPYEEWIRHLRRFPYPTTSYK